MATEQPETAVDICMQIRARLT